MNPPTPETQQSIFGQLQWSHIWLAAMTALWGGVVSYFRRVQAGHPHSWTSAFMHLSTSGFAGLMCWLACVHFAVPEFLTAICTGLAGHMGAEFIKLMEGRAKARLGIADKKDGEAK